jgi:predicted small secreted protein
MIGQIMKLIFAAVVLCNLASCGTIDGIGRDISGGANTVGGWFR